MIKSSNNSVVRYFGLTVFTLVSLLVIFCIFAASPEPTRINRSSDTEYGSSWRLEGTGSIEFPFSVMGRKGETLTLTGRLPEVIPEHYSMCFYAMYSKSEVSVNGKVIGTYGGKMPLPFGHMQGNIRVLIPLEPSMGGCDVTLKITPYYTQHMDLGNITFDHTGELKFSIVMDNLLRLIVCTIMFTIGLITCVFTLNQILERSARNIRLFGNFAFFDFTIIFWIVCSSDIPQLFISNNETVSLISYLCLAVMVIPYNGFCEQLLPSGAKAFRRLQFIGWFLPLINVIGFVTGLAEPPEILILSHIYIVAGILASICFAIKEWRGNVDSKLLIVSIIVIVAAALAGLAAFYISPSTGAAGNIFGVGFVLFTSMLFSIVLYRQMKLIDERRYMDTYKELAYKDILTGLGNRAAFDQYCSSLGERISQGDEITLFMFDVNYLKRVNDTYGHSAGDSLIKAAASCISSVFGSYGNCYRMGGDEFAVIIVKTGTEPQELTERFHEALDNRNADTLVKLSVASGYIVLPYRSGSAFLHELFVYADDAMYENKRKYHRTIN